MDGLYSLLLVVNKWGDLISIAGALLYGALRLVKAIRNRMRTDWRRVNHKNTAVLVESKAAADKEDENGWLFELGKCIFLLDCKHEYSREFRKEKYRTLNIVDHALNQFTILDSMMSALGENLLDSQAEMREQLSRIKRMQSQLNDMSALEAVDAVSFACINRLLEKRATQLQTALAFCIAGSPNLALTMQKLKKAKRFISGMEAPEHE